MSYSNYVCVFQRAPIDEGHKKVVVIENNIVTSDGLACDWIYGHLFWSDTGTNSIMMSDFDGKMIATVIRDSKFPVFRIFNHFTVYF